MPLVHPDALHFKKPVASYWEETAARLSVPLEPLKREENCDVAIIGGGFTGLSAALELAERGVDVRLLEAGPIGWGASGRNGGFACVGSHKLSYGKMISRYGLEETRAFYATMKDSVALVADNSARHGIDVWKHGDGEVSLAHLPSRMAEFREEQEFMAKVFGERTELIDPSALRQEGMQGPHFHGGLRGFTGFGVHPLNYVRGLTAATYKAGAKLHPVSHVVRWEEGVGEHRLYTDQGKLTAKRVLVATNGYTPEKLSSRHHGRLLPALSNILVTRTLSEDEKAAQGWTSSTMAYDSRNLLHYFRLLPNNRFLFGGRGGTDSSNAGAQIYRDKLTATFHKLFPAWSEVDISHFWRGHVCLARDLVPYVGPLDDNRSVWTALAYHGNGVAMASWCGRAVARMMMGVDARAPAVITRRLARFPLPAFRPMYLKGAYVWFNLKDAR